MARESNDDLAATARYMRRPDDVMRLARLGSFHPCRLSFMRILLRRMRKERWRFIRQSWEIDRSGVGCAVYTAAGPHRSYSLVCFAHDLPPEQRSDRVIATAWDATFALFDGVPGEEDIARLAANVPRQEAGRVSDRELTLSRANRSVRLFDHVVGELAEGRQPHVERLEEVGYLMRTTAVYGSGKFGAADRALIACRPELKAPFQAEMLTVWLIRAFTVDLAEHMARTRGGDKAVTIAPHLRRRIGVGNSTGLGMAPFLVTHPVLVNNWIAARETALARVRALQEAGSGTPAAFRRALVEAIENAALWRSDHPIQTLRLTSLRQDLATIEAGTRGPDAFAELHPWDVLWRWGEERLSLEGQEALVSLIIEPHGDLVDDLAEDMDVDEDRFFAIEGAMPLNRLRAIIEDSYGWALAVDYETPSNCARFWYVSEEKLEPRLGERHEEDGSEREQPLAVGRDVKALMRDVRQWRGEPTVAAFLAGMPEHRHAIRRVQQAVDHPYSEIRDNLISAELLPIDLLRCKLSFFGASRFDPRSDRWVRISMFQGAPYPHEIKGESA